LFQFNFITLVIVYNISQEVDWAKATFAPVVAYVPGQMHGPPGAVCTYDY